MAAWEQEGFVLRESLRPCTSRDVRLLAQRVRGDWVLVCPGPPPDAFQARQLLDAMVSYDADAVASTPLGSLPSGVSRPQQQPSHQGPPGNAAAGTFRDGRPLQNPVWLVRGDLFRRLRLTGPASALRWELPTRLHQYGADVLAVPLERAVGGHSVTDERGSKRWVGELATWWRCCILDRRFTDHAGYYVLASVARATRYHRWILALAHKFLGQRVLEAGAGIGNLSQFLLARERLVLADLDPLYIQRLHRRFRHAPHVRIDRADLTQPVEFHRWKAERLDTVFCSNVLEHLPGDEEVLRCFFDVLVPGGHCVIVVPAGRWLYTGVDRALGHLRRYTRGELAEKMRGAGFELVFQRQFNRLGAVGWGISGHLLRRRLLTPAQLLWFDRLHILARLLEYVLPVPGMSVMAVGRRPLEEAAGGRRAA